MSDGDNEIPTDAEGLRKSVMREPLTPPPDEPVVDIPPPLPPEFRHRVIDRVAAATGGQVFNCLCMICPLAHWEIIWDVDFPPSREDTLEPPFPAGTRDRGTGGRWGIEAQCRARNAQVAKYGPSKESLGKLVRAIGSSVVGDCSDYDEAVERWQEKTIKAGITEAVKDEGTTTESL